MAQNKHVINKLYPEVEYCVRAQPDIIENPNVLSSDWTCHFTSHSPLNPGVFLRTAQSPTPKLAPQLVLDGGHAIALSIILTASSNFTFLTTELQTTL